MFQSRTAHRVLPIIILGALCSHALAGDGEPWLTLVKENDRIVAEPALGVADNQQKRYVWGDINNNGWIDLVVMRKQPFTSAGKRINVLFINESGILVDRTAEYASNAAQDQIVTSPGWPEWNTTNTLAGQTWDYNNPPFNPDQGFLTPTNDRSGFLADLTNNGWLDLVTAATISDGDPKHIGHPRIYVNLANAPQTNNWQGFRFENARIPAMLSYAGNAGFNPRFEAVAAGDVNGNGYADLWFGDSDDAGAGGLAQPPGADFNDRLLANAGAANPGFFSDVTSSSFMGVVPIPSQNDPPFPLSSTSWAAAIVDLNLNGAADIVKLTSIMQPSYIGAAYNDLAHPGQFSSYQYIAGFAPTYFSIGDLNNNNRPDILITDDIVDRYRLNLATDTNGHVIWSPVTMLPEQNVGFGGNSVIVDLDNSGWNDIIIADVTFAIGPCLNPRRTNIYRNNQNAPNVTFTNESQILSSDERRGVYDVAAFDLTGNGWTDLIFGRCNSTDVWINVPFSQPCPADLTGNGFVGVPDLLELLSCWGPITPGCESADLTGSNSIGVPDLIDLLGQWGECP